MGLQLNITFSAVSQNKVPKCEHSPQVWMLMDLKTTDMNGFEIVKVLLWICRLCRRLWTFSPMWPRALDHVMQTRPPCGSQQMQRRPTWPLSSHWWVTSSPLKASSITTVHKTPVTFMSLKILLLVLPAVATRWQLAAACFCFGATDFWCSYCFSPECYIQ